MKHINKLKNITGIIAIFIAMITITSCEDELVLPATGSIADKTPPKAVFSAKQGEGLADEWKTYSFSNQSTSATTYAWDFGNGKTATTKDGSTTFAGEGKFTVKLTASDALGVASTVSKEITVVKPPTPAAIVPIIHDASFENDDSDGGATGDGRDSWRLSGAEIMQITSSPVFEGAKAGKFPSSGTRTAYQELTVTPNSDYILTYYYTMKTSPTGTITVSLVAGGNGDLDAAKKAAVLASNSGADQTSASDYVKVDLPFNSGANSTIAILITNQGNESRIDSFSIKAK